MPAIWFARAIRGDFGIHSHILNCPDLSAFKYNLVGVDDRGITILLKALESKQPDFCLLQLIYLAGLDLNHCDKFG